MKMRAFCILFIILYPLFNLFSQDSGVTNADRELIEQLLLTMVGDSCGINDIVCVDSVLKPLDPDEGGFEDPYNTLSDCLVFTCSRINPDPNIDSEYKQSVGIFKDGQIMALLDTIIETYSSSSGRIKAIAELNNDGEVDIIITRTLGVSPPPWEGYWIFSWNDLSLRLISAIDEETQESPLRSPWNFIKLVDIDGDEIIELVTEYEDDGVEKRVFYSWDGQYYGDWGIAYSPLPSGAYTRNNLDASIRSDVLRDADTLLYHYCVTNMPSSKQMIDEFFLESPDTLFEVGNSPVDWVMAGQRGRYFGWIALPGFNKFLAKGKTDSSFRFKDTHLPAITNGFIRGNTLSDNFFVDSQLDWDKVYQDVLTNSKVVKTIAPHFQLKIINPLQMLDTLTSYTTQSRSLGWITDQVTADKYLAYFASAKTNLQESDIDSTRIILQQVLSDADIDSTANLSSEAYALLRYNTEYLIDHLSVAQLKLSAKVFLQGPYNTGTGLMNTTLNSSGLLTSHFGAIPIPVSAVDSINIEIRDSASAAQSTIRKYAPAWLMSDGSIRDFSDTTKEYVEFDTVAGDYYIVIRHRNHLAVMSSGTFALSETGILYDFTTAQTQAYGTNPMVSLAGVYGLYAGDVNGDGVVKYNLSNNDRLLIYNRIGNAGFNVTVNGYYSEDLNLDGVVKYNLSSNDRLLIYNVIGNGGFNVTKGTQVPN